MANQNFRVKKGLEVGLGATILYADQNGVGINSLAPRTNLDVRGEIVTDKLTVEGQLQSTGVATFSGLTDLAGVTTTTTGDFYVGNGMNVTGFSTFKDDVLIDADLEVTGTLDIFRIDVEQANVSGVLTAANIVATASTTSQANIGTATIDELVVTGVSSFVGFATFNNDVSIGGTLTINGDLIVTDDIFKDEISGRNGNFTGVLTANNFVATAATIGVATITQEYVGTSTITKADIGFATITNSYTGIATIGDGTGTVLDVTGFSTFSGDTFMDGDLDVTGTLDIFRIDVVEANVTGVATVSNLVGAAATITDLEFTTATGTDLVSTGATFTTSSLGIATATDVTIYNQLIDSNGQVGAGDSILANLGGKLQWVFPDQVGVSTEFEPGSTFYVAENGSDANDGLSPEKPWSSVSYALSQISSGSNNVLLIGAGEYTETFPLDVPDGLTVKGSGQRSTTIRPTPTELGTEINDGFRLGDVSTVEDLTITGMYKPLAGNAYAFVYRPGATIATRSPYVQRVTVLNKGTSQTAEDPFGYGTANAYPTTKVAAGGVLADGSVVSASSLEAGFLLNEVTIFCPKNTGVEMVNGARVEFLNGFTYFADRGIYGRSDLTTGFGGAGKTRLRFEGVTAAATDTIEYYDSDNTTVLASGTVDSNDGTYVYLTNSGVGTFASARNRQAKAVTFVNTAQISTAQSKFGGSSLDVSSSAGDAVTLAESPDFGFGTGDFTIELWTYFNVLGADRTFIDFRSTLDTDQAIELHKNATGNIEVLIANGVIITSTSSLSTGQWYHIAVAKESGTIRLFIDGAAEGSVASALDLGVAKPLVIGSDHTQSDGPNGYVDDVRIIKGVAKYTGAFTAPAVALKSDESTVLLLHFDGSDADTTTSDDVITYQDIRVNSVVDPQGDSKILLADYSQFGADLRSIGCAVEYGTFGVIADGEGSTLRLMAVNFNHVGAGGDLSNDPLKAIQTNEVQELNGGDVSYVSIDHKGDFRVGEQFYVDQETGSVRFSSEVTDLTSLSTLTITDGNTSSVITPSSGRFGNIQISGNQIESVTGNVEIETAGSGEVNIYANTNILGILTAQVLEANAIIRNDTSIAIDDNGSDGTIRFITDGVEGFRLDNQQQVGIGTQAVRADLDVIGQTLVEDINVTGIATINQANVAVATVTDATITDATVGFATITDAFIGVSTVGFSTMEYAYIAIGTAGLLNVTQTAVFEGDLTIEGNTVLEQNLSVGGTAGFSTDVYAQRDLYVEKNLQVTGISTFVGFTTFQGDISVGGTVRINGDLIVTDDIFKDEISGRNGNFTGVLTANNFVATAATIAHLDAPLSTLGVSTVGYASITDANVGVATIGFSTMTTAFIGIGTAGILNVTENAIFEGDLTIQGDATFLQNVGVGTDLTVGRLVDTPNANIGVATVGFATITDSYLGVSTIGFATMSYAFIGIGTAGILNVTETAIFEGDLTIQGDASFQQNVAISSDLSVGKNLEVTGLSTFVGVSSFQENVEFYKNVSIGGTVTITGDLIVDDITYDHSEGNTLQIAGIATVNGATDLNDTLDVAGDATFQQNVAIGTDLTVVGNVDVGGHTELDSLRVSGLSTFQANVDVDAALDVQEDATFQKSVAIGTDLTVGRNVEVTGLSTFVGLGTFQDDLYVQNDLYVGGVLNFESVSGKFLNVTGVGTIANLVGSAATISNVDFEFASIGTAADQPALEVLGISTFTGVSNLTTAVVGYATITEAEVGVATIGFSTMTYAYIGVGTAAILNVTQTSIFEGDLEVDGKSTLNGTLSVGGTAGFSTDVYAQRDLYVARNLEVAGLSTFVGVSSFKDAVYFDGNISIGGTVTITGDIVVDDITYDTVSGNQLNIGGIGTITNLVSSAATITYLDAATSNLGVTTVGFASITNEIVGTSTVGFSTMSYAFIGVGTAAILNVTSTSIFEGDLDVQGNATLQQNLSVGGTAGFSTDVYVNELLDVTGHTELDTLNVSGLSTFNSTVDVNANLDVSGNVTIGGTVTITGDLIVDDITYDHIQGNTLDITGIATVNGAADFNSTINVAEDATFQQSVAISTDLTVGRNLEVSGITTLQTAIIPNLSFTDAVGTSATITTLRVTNLIADGGSGGGGGTGIDSTSVNTENLNVTGIATINTGIVTSLFVESATVDYADIGIATITAIVGTAATITDLTVTNFTSAGGGSQIDDDITTRHLSVTGVSTFAGISTFQDNVHINGTLTVDSGSTLAGATVGGALTVTGLSTFTSDAHINGQLQVDGLTGFGASVAIDDSLSVASNIIAGGTIAAINNISVGQNANIDNDLNVVQDATIGNTLYVNGISTFVSNSRFEQDVEVLNNVSIGGTLTITGDLIVDDITYDTVSGNQLNISGVGTIVNFVSTASTIGILTFTDAIGTALTVTDLTYTSLTSDDGSTSIGEDITTRNLNVTGVSTFISTATFQSDVDINGNLSVGGTSNFVDRVYMDNLEVSGFSTFKNTVEILGDLEVTGTQNVSEFGAGNFNVSGVGTIFRLDVLTTATIPTGILTHTKTETLEVTGLSTFRDLARFDGDVSIGGTVTITGDLIVDDITYDTVSGNQLNIGGIGTVTNFVSTASTITNLDVTNAQIGLATITNTVGTSATFTNLTYTTLTSDGGGTSIGEDITTRHLSVTGVATVADHLEVSDTLNVAGLSTFVGFSTFQGDVSIGGTLRIAGDLIIVDDIFQDEISARNGNFTGILTAANFVSTAATITDATITDAGITNANIGVATVGFSSLTDALIGVATVTTLGVTTATATFLGFTESVGTALTVTDLTYTTLTDANGDTTIGQDITTRNLQVTGVSTFVGLTTTFNEMYVGTDLYVERNLSVAGVTTFTGITTTAGDAYVGQDLYVARHLDVIGIGTFQDINTKSDIRYKENIVQVEDALDKVSQLRGVEFTWKNDGSESGGVIAQEVEQVFPNLVRGEDPKVVNYNGLIGALIEAVKELKSENNELRSRIEKLEG